MPAPITSNAARLAAGIAAVALIIAGAALTLRHQRETTAVVTTPGVNVDTRGSDFKIVAPHTSIQKDRKGTHLQAPGVDIELPPKSAK